MTKEMTKGSPMRLILGFALPTLLGLLFQQLYNVVDTMIVGQLLGSNALAAVGATGSLNFLVIGFCTGICSGFAIPVAQQFGAGDHERMRQFVGNGGLLCVTFGAVITLATTLLCGSILRTMDTPSDIYLQSYQYIFIIFAGIPATILYNYLSGILRALGDSKSPVLFLALSSVLNIGLDILLLSVFHWGVSGAAIATVISQLVSGLASLLYIWKKVPLLHTRISHWKASRSALAGLCGMGLPMGLQYSITALGSILLQASVNGLGTDYVAAVAASCKLSCFFACPYDAMGATMATYCGQNVGAGKLDRLRRGILACTWLGMGYYVLAALVMCLGGPTLALLFLKPTETKVISLMVRHLGTNALAYGFLALVNILRFSIQGMGFSQLAMLAGLMEMIARSAAGILLVPAWGFTAACLASPLAWVLADAFLIPATVLCIRHLEQPMHPARPHRLSHI